LEVKSLGESAEERRHRNALEKSSEDFILQFAMLSEGLLRALRADIGGERKGTTILSELEGRELKRGR